MDELGDAFVFFDFIEAVVDEGGWGVDDEEEKGMIHFV